MSAARTMVLFDWNGTIVIDADRARDALNGVLREFGGEDVSSEAFPTTFRLPMASMFDDLGLPAEHGPEAERRWNERMAQRTTTLRPGAATALRRLRADGAWLGVVSAAAAEAVAFDRRTLDVPDRWDAVLAPATDKTAILRALRHHGDAAYYVGDTPYDMRCAVEAGYQPIGVRGGYAPTAALLEAGAQQLIESLDELVAIVGAGTANAA